MAQTQHTPGPWDSILTSAPIHIEGTTHLVVDEDGNLLAFIPSWIGDPVEAAEAAANLRLFLAGNDMLTALADLVQFADDHGLEQEKGGVGIILAARAAIAKAEGSTNA